MKPFLTFLFTLSVLYMITSLPTFAVYDFVDEDIRTTCRQLMKAALSNELQKEDSPAELVLDFVGGSDADSAKQFIKEQLEESDTQNLPVWGLNLGCVIN